MRLLVLLLSQALEILAEEGKLDLLFCDVVMLDGINGHKLAQQRLDLKVLLTSGFTSKPLPILKKMEQFQVKGCNNLNQLFMFCHSAKQTYAYTVAMGATNSRYSLSTIPLSVIGRRLECRVLSLILGCILIFAAPPHSLAAKLKSEQPPLILGVHPYRSAVTLMESYKPLASYLSRKTGRVITVKISKNYRTHIQLIGENKLDIAFMGPASYVEMVAHYGSKPLLARQVIQGSPTFQGKIVVRQESTISSLAELAGKHFAFGDVASTMSHLVPRYMLRNAGVTVDQLAGYRFLGSHDNVALAVLMGDFDAGTVKESIYKKYQPRGLKVLATTPTLSEHLFVTRSKLPDEVRQTLSASLYALKDDRQGTTIMNGIEPNMTAWVSVTDADYNNLRTILDSLAKSIQP